MNLLNLHLKDPEALLRGLLGEDLPTVSFQLLGLTRDWLLVSRSV